jgi:AcrR family transcriptional regulator
MNDIHFMTRAPPSFHGRTRDPDAKRAALHKSAFALLAAHRYEAVPVSMIAQHAGVAVGTFYRFYPTKMALLEAMSNGLEEEFVAAMHDAWNGRTEFADKIEALANSLFDTITCHAAEIGVMQMTAGHRPATSKPLGDSIRASIAVFYADGVKAGAFTKQDPTHFAAAAHGLVDGLMRAYLSNQTLAKKATLSKLLAEMLRRLLLR